MVREVDVLSVLPLPPPNDEEIARVAADTARGIIRLLERKGLLSDLRDAAEDPLQDEVNRPGIVKL